MEKMKKKSIVSILTILLICSLSLFIISYSELLVSCSNMFSKKSRFEETIEENNITFLTKDNLIKTYYKVDTWFGEETGICYYFCKVDEDIRDKGIFFDEPNEVFEHDISYLVEHYEEMYEKIPTEHRLDFSKKYYYSSTPMIYYPETNELILIKFVDNSSDRALEKSKKARIRTKKEYINNMINDSNYWCLDEESLLYFYNDDKDDKYEVDYFYFNCDEYQKSRITVYLLMKEAIYPNEIEVLDNVVAVINEEITDFYDSIDERYKYINKTQFYYSNFYTDMNYPNKNIIAVFYPDDNILIVAYKYRKW